MTRVSTTESSNKIPNVLKQLEQTPIGKAAISAWNRKLSETFGKDELDTKKKHDLLIQVLGNKTQYHGYDALLAIDQTDFKKLRESIIHDKKPSVQPRTKNTTQLILVKPKSAKPVDVHIPKLSLEERMALIEAENKQLRKDVDSLLYKAHLAAKVYSVVVL